MQVYSLFFAVAIAIFLGFLADLLFRRFKAPDVLVLIALGALIGPNLIGIVDLQLASQLGSYTPYVAALALAIIMFQAGLELHLREILGSFAAASAFTMLAFTLSALTATLIVWIFIGWDLMVSLLLGVILGGTSGAVVIPLISGLNLRKMTKTVLTLESALTDVLVIVVAMALIVIIQTGHTDPIETIASIGGTFLISGLIGAIGGILWLGVLIVTKRQPYSYMITLGALLALYAITEFALPQSGGGAISALVFGLVLGNRGSLERRLHRRFRVSYEEEIKGFHMQVTFFIRTFFFVYLGLVLSVTYLGFPHLLMGIVIVGSLLLVRFPVVALAKRFISMPKADALAWTLMMPRGLSAAVMSSVPLALGAVSQIDGDMIIGTTAIVILASTIMASIGAFFVHHFVKSTSLFEKEGLMLEDKRG